MLDLRGALARTEDTSSMESDVENHIIDSVLAALVDDLSPIVPAEEQRLRLLHAIEGRHRHAPFTGRVARMFDLDHAAATAALEAIVSPNAWLDGPLPGIRCAPIAVGPRCTGTMNMFIAADPGARFPIHEHLGEERVLVMQGAFREDDGSVARPGDLVVKAASSAHDFVVLDGPPCVCAYSIDFGFQLAQPRAPRER